MTHDAANLDAHSELPSRDAIVVGSGPNGLAAAIRLAQAGRSVCVLEAENPRPEVEYGPRRLRSPALCMTSVHPCIPMAVCSPFLRTLPLDQHGLEWVTPTVALAHPFEDGSAALLHNSLDHTIAGLGIDGPAYRNLIGEFVGNWQDFMDDALSQPRFPRHPFMMANFGLRALRSASRLARSYFKTERARGLFAGIAAHSILPLEMAGTSAPALVLAIAAHAAGWPIVRGGSQQLTQAMISYLESLGGKVITGFKVESLGPASATQDHSL